MAQVTGAAPRVLYVDDDTRALQLLKGQAGKQFTVVTAPSGEKGLDLLRNQGPFAVVVSDYQMSGMSGLEFFSRAREVAPESTRLLLTGHPDLAVAIGAVNDGYCFRFLVKPCTRAVMVRNLEAAAEQSRLVLARRALLEKTLAASIKALTDLLALASPAAFGRAARAKDRVAMLMDHYDLRDRWEVEVAAGLSQIGCVSLPPETALKVYQGEALTPEETAMVERLPALAEQIIADIPGMEGVRTILRYQDTHFDGSGSPDDGVEAEQIPWGARALKVVLDYDVLEAQHVARRAAFDTMRGRDGWYDPQILETFAERWGAKAEQEVIEEVAIEEVATGMTFVEDVLTRTGEMLIARGGAVTGSLLERIRNLGASLISGPVKIADRARPPGSGAGGPQSPVSPDHP